MKSNYFAVIPYINPFLTFPGNVAIIFRIKVTEVLRFEGNSGEDLVQRSPNTFDQVP